MPKIAVTANAFSRNEALVEALREHFPESSLNPRSRYSERELVDALREADGAIVGLDKITDGVLRECPRLKVIAKYGVGLDNIDVDACAKRGVTVAWEPGVNRRAVSELTLGFMSGLVRNWYRTSLELKAGTWNKSGGRNLTGKTIGIIGVGNVGKDVVFLLAPYGCRILVNDVREDEEQKEFYRVHHLTEATKEQIFREADVVTLHTPITESTRHLVNMETIGMMKSSSFIVNTSRGGIVDEVALLQSLRDKTIAGAGLDVYQGEDDPEFYKTPRYQELISLPNVITTPHIGGNSEEAVLAMGQSAISGLKKFFSI